MQKECGKKHKLLIKKQGKKQGRLRQSTPIRELNTVASERSIISPLLLKIESIRSKNKSLPFSSKQNDISRRMSRSTNMKYYSTSTLPRNENSRPYTIGAVNNNNNNIMKQTNNFRLIPFHRKSEYSELKVAGKNPLSTPKKNNSRIEKELKGERKKREMSVGDVNDVKDRETEDIKNERKDIKNERKNIKNVIYKEKINNREIVSMNIKGIKRDLNMDNNKDRLERKRSEVEVLIRGIGEQRHNNNNNNIEDIEDIKDPGIRGSAPNASTAHNTSTAHNASTAPNASDAIGIGTSPTPPKPLEREIIRARHELHNRHLEFTSPLYGLYNQPTDTIPIQPSTHTAHKLHINNAQITVIRTLPPPTHPQFSDHSSFPTCIGQQPPLPRNSPHVLYSAEPTSKYMHGGPKWRWDSSVKLGVVGDTPNIYNIQNAHNAHNKHNMDLNKRNQVIVNLYGSSGRRNRTSSGQSMTGRLSTPPHAKLGSPLDPSPIFKCNVSKRYSPTFFPRKSELEVEVEVEEGEERINSLERENINNTNNINTINNNNNIEEQEIITISDPPMGESVSKMTTPLMPRFSSRSDNPLTLTETHPKLLSKALISHQRTNSVSNLRHSTTAANNLFECRKSYNSISKTARNTPSPHSNTLLKIPNNNNNNRFREGSRLIPIIKPKSAAQQRKITAQRKYRYGGGSIDYNHKYTPEDNINAHTNANLNTNANTHIPGNLTGRLSPYERFSNNNSRHGRNFTKYVRSLPTSPLPFFSQKNDNSHLWDMKDEEGLPQYGGPNFCLQLATNNYTPKRKQNEIISDPVIDEILMSSKLRYFVKNLKTSDRFTTDLLGSQYYKQNYVSNLKNIQKQAKSNNKGVGKIMLSNLWASTRGINQSKEIKLVLARDIEREKQQLLQAEKNGGIGGLILGDNGWIIGNPV